MREKDNPAKISLILDANFLMTPAQFKVNIFDEVNRLIDKPYELIVPNYIIKELKSIEKTSEKGLDSRAATLALKLVKRCKILALDTKGPTDAALIKLAKEKGNSVICTNDKELKKKARKLNLPVIYLRAKSHLALDGHLN